MEVLDRGPGLDGETRANVGQPGFSTKPNGLGLGLFLTHAIIERFGGRVRLRNRDGGGVRTQITLPFVFGQEAALV